MKYYKATDKDMKCRGYQFTLGVWSDPVAGPLVLCKNGYHFCTSPSGVWAHYDDAGTRVFECEVDDAIISTEPGADTKSVCRRVKLVSEIVVAGNGNTGVRNTGDRNAGHCNTGHCNAGDRNTGDQNTGHCNTGVRNTGNCNTGDWNTGDCNTGVRNTGNCNTGNWNTGDCNTGARNTGNWNTGVRNTGVRNTGHWNTGDCNTGDRNTGHCNTGDRNTGDWNIGSHHTGVFGLGEAPFLSFGKPADRKTFPFARARQLFEDMKNERFDYSSYLDIPNATVKKIEAFHKAYKEAHK